MSHVCNAEYLLKDLKDFDLNMLMNLGSKQRLTPEDTKCVLEWTRKCQAENPAENGYCELFSNLAIRIINDTKSVENNMEK